MQIAAPESLKTPLYVPKPILMGPGPTNCHPRILRALGQPELGIFNPELSRIMDEVKEGLQYAFQTQNRLTLGLGTSGHGGMEALLDNLLEKNDTVLITVNGIWGHRARLMAEKTGAKVVTIQTEPGDNFTLEQIEKAIKHHKPTLFFTIQGESSTGVFQEIAGIGKICHRNNCLFGVDTVASLGGVPFEMDRWDVDAVYTGSQKVLGSSPGITPISFSRKAEEKLFNRKTQLKTYYWDLRLVGDYWNCFGNPRSYHYTISNALVYGLREALALLVQEGLENCIDRHEKSALALWKGLEELGLELFVKDPKKRLATVTAIRVPSGVDAKKLCDFILQQFGLEISGGLGPTAGKVLRIGLLGPNATLDKVGFVLKAIQGGLAHAKL